MSDDTDKLKQRAIFTVGGLILGWSLFKVLNRLSPSGQAGEDTQQNEALKPNQQASEAGSAEMNIVRDEIKQLSMRVTQRDSVQLINAINMRLERDQSEHTTTQDFLEKARVRLVQVDHLKDMFKDLRPLVSPIYAKASANTQEGTTIETTLFSRPGTFCLQEKFYGKLSELQTSLKFLRAAATRDIYCDPAKTKAVIATCGGLVPGMNVVIRSIVKCLEQEYGVQDIHGAKYGFSGLTKPENWRKLTSENLNGIQDKGGSVLGVAGPPASMEDVLQKLIENGITQVYLIGGIGTLRASKELKDMLRERADVRMSIVVIPTSIDNNVPFIDQTFGFATATQEAIPFIDAANVEAEAAEYGVGIVRMPGRHCGYFPVSAALASRDVNICIVPDLLFQLYGPNGVYEAIIERAKVKGHCIIVVSDGAYKHGVIESDKAQVRQRAPNAPKIDPNDPDSVDLALFMKSDLGKYAKENHGVALTIKYLDPRQVIRARPANSKDTDLCSALGYVTVHSAMNGYTDYATCKVREQLTMIPLDVIVSQGARKMQRKDIEWQRLILSTGQSNFLSRENQMQALMDEQNDTIDRQQKLMNLKLKIALDLPIDDEPLSEDQISVAHAKIFNPEASSDFFGI